VKSSRKSETTDIVPIAPARARNDNNNRDIVTIDVDPMTVMKTIAAGICLAGIQLIEAHRGRSLPPAKKGSDVLTAEEVAEFLGLDRKTVYEYAGRGEIPCQRLGKRMLFSRAALVAWLSPCSKRSSESDST
jgi:excisionase family DNA binding protein